MQICLVYMGLPEPGQISTSISNGGKLPPLPLFFSTSSAVVGLFQLELLLALTNRQEVP